MRVHGGPRIAQAAALAAAVLALAGPAAAQTLRVVVVPGLELADLEPLASRGAVGLLVPGAGPEVSEASALAALERGRVRNSLLGGLPEGPPLVEVEQAGAPAAAGPAIVLGLPQGGDQPNDRRYPVAVLAPGYEGLLTSASTRIAGLVSIADVAPTALGGERALSSVAADDPVAELARLDARIRDNGRVRPLAALAAGILILALAAVRPAAAVLGFAALLAVNLVLGAAGVSALWAVLLGTALAVAVGAPLLALAARRPVALALVLAGAVGAYLLALGVDEAAVALSPLGPTQNSRFFGLSNLLSAVMLLPALASAAVLRLRLGWAAALLAAATALVTIAGSRFGADGGTALVLVAAYAVLAVELSGARRRAAVGAAAVVAAAVAALVAVDVVSGSSSHLTDAVGAGPGSFASDLRDRLLVSWERATERWYVALLVALAVLVLLALAVRLIALGVPRAQRALPLSLAVATLVSLLVNDSPLDVAAIGLVAYVAAQAYVRSDEAPPARGAARRGYASALT